MTTLRELCNKAIALDKDSDEFEFALSDILQEHGIDFNGAGALETVIAAFVAEREAGRREGLAASGHLCLELSKTVDARENLALRKGMHDAGAIILGMTDHEAQRRAQARAQEVASWTLPVRSGSGTEDSTADGREGGGE